MMTGDRSPRVLCAFDASEPSLLAAHGAAWLAGALCAPLELVYVVDHDDLPALPPHGAGIDPYVRDALPEIQEQIAEDAARADLEAALSGLPHTDVTGTVLTGWPATVIRRRAARLRRHASGDRDCGAPGVPAPPSRQRLGSARRRRALPGDRRAAGAALREPGPVLVGDDGSEHSRRAVRHAEALSARLDRGLERMHVEEGDPVAQLARAARERGACAVVAGTRGRGPLLGQLFGSVSTGLVRAAGRPVMLVSEHAREPS